MASSALSGDVALFADREAAEEKAVHAKKDIAVRNQIRIAGTGVSDQELQSTLVKKLQYDRVGYGTTAFNAIGVSVHEGMVTLGGHAYARWTSLPRMLPLPIPQAFRM